MNKPSAILDSRPLIYIANSTWYLCHYRSLLITRVKSRLTPHVLALAPYDSSFQKLSRLLIHIPWKLNRALSFRIIPLVKSFLRLYFLLRATKPRLIHSHTLTANLLSAIATSLLGIPIVISFAGLGRLHTTSSIAKKVLIYTLKIIAFFGQTQRTNTLLNFQHVSRSALIFQNPNDLEFFRRNIKSYPTNRIFLIPGSGVPPCYFEPISNSPWSHTDALSQTATFIYCARLLKSKGIVDFFDYSALLPSHTFLIFGSLDPSSSDSLTPDEFSELLSNHPNVHYRGQVDHPLLNNFVNPVLVVPSVYGEGFPRAIVEAFARSIPVICTRNALCSSIDQQSVFTLDKDNLTSFADAFNQIRSSHARSDLSHLLHSNRLISEQRYSESFIADQTIAVYEQLLSELPDPYFCTRQRTQILTHLSQ